MQSGRAVRAIEAGAIVSLVLVACSKTPVSGRYCSEKDDHECVWVDLDHELVTFYEKGLPKDVKASYTDGTLDARPQDGKYAGKAVKLSFDRNDPSALDFEVNGPTAADTLRARYLRRHY